MLKPYDGYKEANIPWLEKVPTQWDIRRLYSFVKERIIINNQGEELLSVYLNIGVVNYKDSSQKQVHKPSEDMSKYQLVEIGDIVLNNQQAWRGSVGVSKSRGIVSPAYYVLKLTENYNDSFINYLIRNNSIVEQFVLSSKGVGSIQRTLYTPYLKNVLLAIPPREEQDQIVKYLDWQTSKINTLIKAKKKQIELLKEQKQAVINKAVTKGLDDTVPMKDSGVEWLGYVPKGWEVKPLKYFVSSNDESLSNSEPDTLELSYIDISTVGFTRLKTKPIKYIFKDAPSRARRIVKTGDTIISTVRTYLKSMCYIDETLDKNIVSTGFSVLRPKDIGLPKLLAYTLSCNYFVNEISKKSIGVSYPAISDSRLLDIKIVFPKTLKEQLNIYEFIEEKTALIDTAIAVIKKEINLVSEYKTSLISSVVTGKVDVRDVIIPKFEVMKELLENEGRYEESEDE